MHLVASINIQVTVLSSERSVSLKMNETMTVDAAKFMISKKLSILPYQQKLLCTGKKLKGHLTLSHYNGLPEWPNLQLIESTLVFYTTRSITHAHTHTHTHTHTLVAYAWNF